MLESREVKHFSDGSTYEGQWSGGKKHGFGVLKSKDGSVYTGSFKNDKMDGYGEFEVGDRIF